MFEKIDKTLKEKIILLNNDSFIDIIVYANSIGNLSRSIYKSLNFVNQIKFFHPHQHHNLPRINRY